MIVVSTPAASAAGFFAPLQISVYRAGVPPVSMRYEHFMSSTVCYLRSTGTALQISVYRADKKAPVLNSVQNNLPEGFLRGKRKKCWKKTDRFAFSLGRWESPSILLRCPANVLGDAAPSSLAVRLGCPISSLPQRGCVSYRPRHTLILRSSCHRQRGATRPLPLAQVAFSATGSAPIAPHAGGTWKWYHIFRKPSSITY